MRDKQDTQVSEDERSDRDAELSMEEILRRQALRNVLRPATTRLKSGRSEQVYGVAPQ